MSGGKAGGKVRITDYYGSFLLGVCWGPITVLRGVWIGEKLALGTNVRGGRVFNIIRRDLHGGEKKEGGVAGGLWLLPGGKKQLLPTLLAQKLHGRPPTEAPGYRDLFCIGLTEPSPGDVGYPVADGTVLNYAEGTDISDAGYGGFGPTGNEGMTGFYVGSNNPYLKSVWVELTRASDGWFPETSLIYRTPEDRALWEGGTPPEGILGKPDSNFVHIAYEAFTNAAWGMGVPVWGMDDASWRLAAQQCYDENLAGSFLWTQPMTVERFAQMIADHIRAMFFPDPETGLVSIRLIRPDYEEIGLPVYTPDNSDLQDSSVRDASEIVNEVVVEWTNPETDETESVYAQDLASIANIGEPVSERHAYSFFRRQDLADAAAHRDVFLKTAPLRSCVIELPPNSERRRPGDVVRVQWPSEGLDDVTFRVMRVAVGNPAGRNQVLTLLEDAFSLQALFGQDREGSTGSPDEFVVQPPSYLATYTLPYYALVQLGVTPDDGDEYVAVLVATDQRGAYGAQLWTNRTTNTGASVQRNVAEAAMNRRAELNEDLSVEATTANVEVLLMGFGPPITVGDFVMFGPDEETAELCLITAITGSGYTLMRGILDTVPRAWATGTVAWVISSDSRFLDPRSYPEGATRTYDVRPITFNAIYETEGVNLVVANVAGRAEAPLRPANVRIDGSAFGGANSTLTVGLGFTVTWNNRNRLTEDNVILGWQEAAVTPEAGQTTTVRVETLGGTMVYQATGITGGSHAVTLPGGTTGAHRLRVWSVRDGLESFQEITRMITI